MALILEPSRELAEQTYSNIATFSKYLDAPKIEHTLIVGGVSVKDQVQVTFILYFSIIIINWEYSLLLLLGITTRSGYCNRNSRTCNW